LSGSMISLEILALAAITIMTAIIYYDFWHRFGGRFDGTAFMRPLKGFLFLTFDDGPASDCCSWGDSIDDAIALRNEIIAIDPSWNFNASTTDNLARVLKEHGAKAIFFVSGSILEHDKKSCLSLKLISVEGNMIGNHGFKHNKFNTMSKTECLKGFELTHRLILATTGKNVDIFRPPYGLWHVGYTLSMWFNNNLAQYGLPIGWSHSTSDWDKKKEHIKLEIISKNVDNLLSNLRDYGKGIVLLQHDVYIYSVLFAKILLERVRMLNDIKLGRPDILIRHVHNICGYPRIPSLIKYYIKARFSLLTQRVFNCTFKKRLT
jgi:hypothetical protein